MKLRSQPAGQVGVGPWLAGSEVRIYGQPGDDTRRRFGDRRLVAWAAVDDRGHFATPLHNAADGTPPTGRVAVQGVGHDGEPLTRLMVPEG